MLTGFLLCLQKTQITEHTLFFFHETHTLHRTLSRKLHFISNSRLKCINTHHAQIIVTGWESISSIQANKIEPSCQECQPWDAHLFTSEKGREEIISFSATFYSYIMSAFSLQNTSVHNTGFQWILKEILPVAKESKTKTWRNMI